MHAVFWFAAGCWFQAARRAGASQDVVPEHEDQAHRSRHRHHAHPHHNPLNLPWHMQVILQLRCSSSWLIRMSVLDSGWSSLHCTGWSLRLHSTVLTPSTLVLLFIFLTIQTTILCSLVIRQRLALNFRFSLFLLQDRIGLSSLICGLFQIS